MKLLGVLAVCMSLLGCAQRVRYSLTTSTTSPTHPNASTCSFRVVNLVPQGEYEEIGTLVPENSYIRVDNPTDFENAVRAQVCSIGGDVVVTEINGGGGYVRGTVLRLARGSASVERVRTE